MSITRLKNKSLAGLDHRPDPGVPAEKIAENLESAPGAGVAQLKSKQEALDEGTKS